jgi:hypothetical protein
MIHFKAIVKRFGQQGEKTGWTYIEVPAAEAGKLLPNNRKGFRVKGHLDQLSIAQVSLIPLGDGDFIIPLNATMRKVIGKSLGHTITVKLSLDRTPLTICAELLECLRDEPAALAYFDKLSPSHQQYYSKWIESAKTDATKAKRIALAVNGMARGLDYGAMLRLQKEENALLKK